MGKKLNPLDVVAAFDLEPEEAVAFLQKKGYAITEGWKDLLAEAHLRAFTVAGVMKLDALVLIKELLGKALDEGETFEDFKKQAEARVTEAGFRGVEGGSLPPTRLENIYRTNLSSAYNAGRFREQQAVAKRNPGSRFLRYNAIIDDRSRDEHAALNNLVLPADDPVWKKIYPPNGFRCRCSVSLLTRKQVEKYGLTVSRDAPTVDVGEGFDVAPDAEYQPDLSGYPAPLVAAYKADIKKNGKPK